MHVSSRKGFTLIELLVVIAIIAVLAVVVVLTLNPAELLRQARDSNRLSDMSTLVHAIGIYQEDLSSGSMGTASTTYLSIPDANASTTAGDACQALGMSTSTTWHCASSSYYRNINAIGWLPINFASTSAGSPLGSLPIDPTNNSSSNLFYTYQTNGNQYEVTSNMESQKYQSIEANDGGTYNDLFEQGTKLTLAAADFGGVVAPVDFENYESGAISSYWGTVAGSSDTTIFKNGSKSWRYAPSSGNQITVHSGGTNTNYAEIVTWWRLDTSSTAAAWDQAETLRMQGTSWNGASDVGVWVDKAGDGSHYELSLGQGSPTGSSGSRYAISTNTWYRLRFVVTANNGSGNAHAELYVNTSGSSWGSATYSLPGLTLASPINTDLEIGDFISQPTSFEINFDDTNVYTSPSS